MGGGFKAFGEELTGVTPQSPVIHHDFRDIQIRVALVKTKLLDGYNFRSMLWASVSVKMPAGFWANLSADHEQEMGQARTQQERSHPELCTSSCIIQRSSAQCVETGAADTCSHTRVQTYMKIHVNDNIRNKAASIYYAPWSEPSPINVYPTMMLADLEKIRIIGARKRQAVKITYHADPAIPNG
ncbi:hypothetical protein B0H13DRAFT_1862809 [Mycena leptocephala]|nr:hypothetical protein B0H13DRAFT_1862809 [Mycena leptocephala]